MWFCSKLWSWVHRLHKRSPRELFAFLSCLTKTLDLQHSKRNNFPKVPRYLAYFFLIAGIIVVRVAYTQCEGLLEQTQRLYRGSYNNDTDFYARESTHLMWISLLYYHPCFDDDQNLFSMVHLTSLPSWQF